MAPIGALAHPAHGPILDLTGWVPALAGCAGLIAAYLLGVRRLRRRTSRRWSGWRSASFAAGALLLGLAWSPPVQGWAHDDIRGHMVQHLLIGMHAPLGLVFGAPLRLLLGGGLAGAGRAIRLAARLPARVIVHPIAAAIVNVGGLYLLYLTPVYASTASPAIHHGVNIHFLLAGYLFAWSIAGPDPLPRGPGPAMRVAVLVVAAGAHAYLAKVLYVRAGELPPGAGQPAELVRQAAVLMYYGGDVAEVVLAVALFTWWRRLRPRRRIGLRGPPPHPAEKDSLT